MNIFKPLSPEQLRNRELTPIEQERLQLIDISFDRLASAARQQFGVELQQPITVTETAERAETNPMDSGEQQPSADDEPLTNFTEATVTQLESYARKQAQSAEDAATRLSSYGQPSQGGGGAGGNYDQEAA